MPKYKFSSKRDYEFVYEALKSAYAELEALEKDVPWFTSDSMELIEDALIIMEDAASAIETE